MAHLITMVHGMDLMTLGIMDIQDGMIPGSTVLVTMLAGTEGGMAIITHGITHTGVEVVISMLDEKDHMEQDGPIATLDMRIKEHMPVLVHAMSITT